MASTKPIGHTVQHFPNSPIGLTTPFFKDGESVLLRKPNYWSPAKVVVHIPNGHVSNGHDKTDKQ